MHSVHAGKGLGTNGGPVAQDYFPFNPYADGGEFGQY